LHDLLAFPGSLAYLTIVAAASKKTGPCSGGAYLRGLASPPAAAAPGEGSSE